MYFFDRRFKPFFLLRNYRAQFKHFYLNQRLRSVIAMDYLEGAIHITKYKLKVGE